MGMLDTLKARYPNMTLVGGAPEWWSYGSKSPAAMARHYVLERGPVLLYMTIATSPSAARWPEEEAIFSTLRYFARAVEPRELFVLSDDYRLDGFGFGSFCLLRTPAHASLKFELGAAAQNVIRGFPAYRCEFRGTEVDATVLFELCKRPGVVNDWFREPRPIIGCVYRDPVQTMGSDRKPWEPSFAELAAVLERAVTKGEAECRITNYAGREFLVAVRASHVGFNGEMMHGAEALLTRLWAALTTNT